MLLAVLSGAGAALYWRHSAAPLQLTTGSYLSPRRALPDFSLIDQRGQAFGPKNLLGHWSLMFFGYTNCPDFCPTTLAMLSQMEKHLRASGAAVRPKVVFVSVDAKRDTPAQLAKYVPYFDPDFIGVTAPSQPAIEAFARKLGVAVVLLPPNADGSYTVDHSGAIFVVDPAGELAAILTGPYTAAAVQSDLRQIESASG
ncbi:MAG TPA: SCO family protein [Steroidobacteraceae bacterium]|jgi:protein SCO1/2|nr:SCO family protein [Steroidobacteraceae bacterium]